LLIVTFVLVLTASDPKLAILHYDKQNQNIETKTPQFVCEMSLQEKLKNFHDKFYQLILEASIFTARV